MGLKGVRPSGSGVFFEGELRDAYRVCLFSRLTTSVLMEIGQFEVLDADSLYDGIRDIDWSEHMSLRTSFAVDLTAKSSAPIDHTHFATLRVKDAIVDQFRALLGGARPDVDRDEPDVRVRIHVDRRGATVYLDLSGAKLHRRGWRVEQGAAPIKETLAAAMLWRAGWPEIAAQGGALCDPMCGSGTFPIEAWMMAADIAPGLDRPEGFGFERWLRYDEAGWMALVEEARERKRAGLAREIGPIVGFDTSHAAIRTARQNVQGMGREAASAIRLQQREVNEAQAPAPTGLMVVNPPYGERLQEREEALVLHERLGEVMIREFMGWRASVITLDREMGMAIPLRATKRYVVYNGPLECVLLHFDIEEDRIFDPDRAHH